jgi:hypothetical protein
MLRAGTGISASVLSDDYKTTFKMGLKTKSDFKADSGSCYGGAR